MMQIEDLRNNVLVTVELNQWECSLVLGASMSIAMKVKDSHTDRLELMHSISRLIRQIKPGPNKDTTTLDCPLDLLDELIQEFNEEYEHIVSDHDDELRLSKLQNSLELAANESWLGMVSSLRDTVTELFGGLVISCQDMERYQHLKWERLQEIRQLIVDVKDLLGKLEDEVTESEVKE